MSENLVSGWVTRLQSGFYAVQTDQGTVTCQLRGRLKRERGAGDVISIGDRVDILLNQDGSGRIETIQPRVRALVRDAEKGRSLLVGLPAAAGASLELVAADLTQPRTLLPEMFNGVGSVVCCTAVKVAPKEGDTADRAKYNQVGASERTTSISFVQLFSKRYIKHPGAFPPPPFHPLPFLLPPPSHRFLPLLLPPPPYPPLLLTNPPPFLSIPPPQAFLPLLPLYFPDCSLIASDLTIL